MLGKAAQDPNPEMKNAVASLCGKLCVTLDNKIVPYCKGIVESLVLNLQHQHSKVRKQTLVGLRDVLCAKGAEPFIDGNPIAQFKFTMNDRS